MTLSIGVDYTPGQWRICEMDQGRLAPLHIFETAGETLEAIRQTCAHYPEPTIVLSLDVTAPFSSLHALSPEQLDRLAQRYHPTPAFTEVREVLRVLRSLNVHSYCAPSVEYLPTVPLYRRLMRPALGTANELCAVITLLHHMHEQQATWGEMNFLYVNASDHGTCVLVVKDSQVINGVGILQGSSLPAAYGYLARLESTGEKSGEEKQRETLQQALNEAFWEGLTQELAGLMAIHHLEDIVVLGRESSRLIERLADIYQVYLFPRAHTEHEGYESALGAALLAEGLDHAGSSAEVVERLRLRQAERTTLLPDL